MRLSASSQRTCAPAGTTSVASRSSKIAGPSAVAPGPKRWSVHAYGEAIDVNTIENPYVEGGRVLRCALQFRKLEEAGWRSI